MRFGEQRHGHQSLEKNDAVLHACGGNDDVAAEILRLFEESLENGLLNIPRNRCQEFILPLEEVDSEREGKDRGSYRLLKAISVFARLKGFNNREATMPIRELDVTGHSLLSLGESKRKAESVVRSLELVVHLARTCSAIVVVRLRNCDLGPDGGDKCTVEIIRLVRRMGIASKSRFLQEVDLRGNHLDADTARKLIETALKERCELRGPAPSTPLWLNLSGNRIRNVEKLFKDLKAWAGWAYDRDGALCLAESEECSQSHCVDGCLLHLPDFFQQSKPEAPIVRMLLMPASPARARQSAPDCPPGAHSRRRSRSRRRVRSRLASPSSRSPSRSRSRFVPRCSSPSLSPGGSSAVASENCSRSTRYSLVASEGQSVSGSEVTMSCSEAVCPASSEQSEGPVEDASVSVDSIASISEASCSEDSSNSPSTSHEIVPVVDRAPHRRVATRRPRRGIPSDLDARLDRLLDSLKSQSAKGCKTSKKEEKKEEKKEKKVKDMQAVKSEKRKHKHKDRRKDKHRSKHKHKHKSKHKHKYHR